MAEPMPQAVSVLGPVEDGRGRIALTHLLEVCATAGVEVGDFDRRILSWLTNFEPSTCQAIAGLIARSAAAQQKRIAELEGLIREQDDRRVDRRDWDEDRCVHCGATVWDEPPHHDDCPILPIVSTGASGG